MIINFWSFPVFLIYFFRKTDSVSNLLLNFENKVRLVILQKKKSLNHNDKRHTDDIVLVLTFRVALLLSAGTAIVK